MGIIPSLPCFERLGRDLYPLPGNLFYPLQLHHASVLHIVKVAEVRLNLNPALVYPKLLSELKNRFNTKLNLNVATVFMLCLVLCLHPWEPSKNPR